MKQVFLDEQKTVVGFDFAEEAFSSIVGSPVSKWYRAIGSLINIHLGNEHADDSQKQPAFDHSLYIWGHWEILRSGEDVVSDNDDQDKIDSFITQESLGTVKSVKLFPIELELFVEFSSGYTMHVLVSEINGSPKWAIIHSFGQYSLHLLDPKKPSFEKTPIILE